MWSKLKKGWDAVVSAVCFQVQTWHIASQGWSEQDIRVLVVCERDVWYWVFLEWLFWDCQTLVCDWVNRAKVRLPEFILNWERAWDEDEPKELIKFRDWYGECVGCLWHLWVCDPLLQWVWKHKSQYRVEFAMTLDEARQKFAHDPDKYRWVEEDLKRHKEYDAEHPEKD